MSIYKNTVLVMIHNLKATAKFLHKAEAHCDERKIDKSVMLGMRLAPDMFNLTRQVQLVTDFGKGCGARLAGVAVPSFPDEETTFDGLYARIDKCVAFLESLEKSAFEGAEIRDVTMKVGGKDVTMAGADYANAAALPNFYFHMATAYNILRHNGVALGKGDFMGRG
jgi:uncharacterized protein